MAGLDGKQKHPEFVDDDFTSSSAIPATSAVAMHPGVGGATLAVYSYLLHTV